MRRKIEGKVEIAKDNFINMYAFTIWSYETSIPYSNYYCLSYFEIIPPKPKTLAEEASPDSVFGFGGSFFSFLDLSC
jgi:hypothetical protein